MTANCECNNVLDTLNGDGAYTKASIAAGQDIFAKAVGYDGTDVYLGYSSSFDSAIWKFPLSFASATALYVSSDPDNDDINAIAVAGSYVFFTHLVSGSYIFSMVPKAGGATTDLLNNGSETILGPVRAVNGLIYLMVSGNPSTNPQLIYEIDPTSLIFTSVVAFTDHDLNNANGGQATAHFDGSVWFPTTNPLDPFHVTTSRYDPATSILTHSGPLSTTYAPAANFVLTPTIDGDGIFAGSDFSTVYRMDSSFNITVVDDSCPLDVTKRTTFNQGSSYGASNTDLIFGDIGDSDGERLRRVCCVAATMMHVGGLRMHGPA